MSSLWPMSRYFSFVKYLNFSRSRFVTLPPIEGLEARIRVASVRAVYCRPKLMRQTTSVSGSASRIFSMSSFCTPQLSITKRFRFGMRFAVFSTSCQPSPILI